MTPVASAEAGSVRLGTPIGRGVLATTILGSAMAFLDGTVVNIALPRIGHQFGASLAGLQWTVTGYTLTLAAFVLVGGSLGDRFGRRRVFLIGVIWFALASLACGLAPSLGFLIAFRAIQGVGSALLTPGALALIQSVFHPDDRAKAVGAWSGLASIAGAAGPLVGGYLIEYASWRWIFLINLPLAVAVVAIALRYVPESRELVAGHFDLPGAVLGALGLAGVTYALVEAGAKGLGSASVIVTAVAGIAALVAFVLVERRSPAPMMPLSLFSSREFSAANALTLTAYGALGALFFFFATYLQVVGGYKPLQAGLASLPTTIVMMTLSSRVGALTTKLGARRLMTAGGVLTAIGTLLLATSGHHPNYWAHILPALLVFSLGMVMVAVPVTVTVLNSTTTDRAGIASGVNNAVARAAGALAVAAFPLLVGLKGDGYADPAKLEPAFSKAMVLSAALFAVSGAIAWFGIRDAATRPTPEHPVEGPQCTTCLPIGSPGLEPDHQRGAGNAPAGVGGASA
ncbi:EmrB/QacA subfamily drug resistance transporter [Catenulispora sp. EB89]|uniref:DHA2 family efflux MFS transporter permease subunit n=1 Tax=Catenulispora sp. EB89 TaxID=3156257 RepID=UPI0035136CBC